MGASIVATAKSCAGEAERLLADEMTLFDTRHILAGIRRYQICDTAVFSACFGDGVVQFSGSMPHTLVAVPERSNEKVDVPSAVLDQLGGSGLVTTPGASFAGDDGASSTCTLCAMTPITCC